MIRPTPRCMFLVTLGLPAALLPVLLADWLWAVWLLGLSGAGLLAGLDGLFCLRPHHLAVKYAVPEALYIGDADSLSLRLGAPHSSRGVEVEALLDLDPDLEQLPAERIRVPGGGGVEHIFPIKARRRGTVKIWALWLRWSGPLGLVRRTFVVAIDTSIPVVPNRRAVRVAALRLFRNRSFLAGLKTERYIGGGSEFDSLREYLPGLDHRAMDWKASARHMKLIARDYRAERNHQVVLAFDTGHLMREPMEGIPKLDHAINAGLLLAFTCLKTGDRVGLFAFDEQVRVFSDPCGGLPAFQRVAHVTADLDYSTGETNFTLGLMTLSSRLKRRTLVVLFTDFVDTITVELMLENLERLSGRHLVVCVTLRDPDLESVVTRKPESLADLNRAVVAGDIVREREVVTRRLRRMGVQCVDVPAKAVSARLIERYLEIKRRELL